jgi:hypothetical protein
MRAMTLVIVAALALPLVKCAQAREIPFSSASSLLSGGSSGQQQFKVIDTSNVAAPVPQPMQKKFSFSSLWPFGKKSKTYSLPQISTMTKPKSANPYLEMAPAPHP